MHLLKPLTTRAALVWLLALLLPLQGLAVGVFASFGPAHVHQRVERSHEAAHVLSAFGHFHASASPERHHHAFGDASVLRSGDDSALDPGQGAVSPSLAVFVALLPHAARWTAPPGRTPWVAQPCWAWLTHVPDGLERPPRFA